LQWNKDKGGGSGEKVAILIGWQHRSLREKISYEHVSNSEWLPRLSCLNLQN
jgi:hypothetical protein